MFAKVFSASLNGLEGELVTVEANLSPGLPAFHIVGLPDLAVREARERIRAAIENSGCTFPNRRIVINLSPANVRKEGSHFDLSIAVSILTCAGMLKSARLAEYSFIGELSLDGQIRKVQGALPLVLGLRDRGLRHIVLPEGNLREASIVQDVTLYPMSRLEQVIEGFGKKKSVPEGLEWEELQRVVKTAAGAYDGAQAGAQAGAEAGAGAQAGADAGAGAGAQAGADAGAHNGAQAGAEAGTGAGAQAGTVSGAEEAGGGAEDEGRKGAASRVGGVLCSAGDYGEVAGQESVKRALQIAAAAAHNILMVGPPGAGKTMMARRLPGILPPLTYEEMLEVTKIYSVAGELSEKQPMVTERPFRAPHHTISAAALVGGGSRPRPGEVTLAHYGVLFLDELPEFNRYVLDVLRQPLEDQQITIARTSGVVTFPSKFYLVAAMNPCPCGYYGHPTRECVCTVPQIRHYHSKISGPMLDRMDMHIEIFPVAYQELAAEYPIRGALDSATMAAQVEAARSIQLERYRGEKILYNSQLSPAQVKKYCPLNRESGLLLEEAFHTMSLSARALQKIIKLSRTIADLEGAEDIRSLHVAEAVRYQCLDKKFRGGGI